MHRIQSQLFADHHNFLRLLHCLEVEIACYEADAQTANLPVIIDIFDYVQFYPERYHHPLEDALFQLMLDKTPEQAKEIRLMWEEHRALEALARRAASLFNAVANDSVVPMAELIQVTREFLQRQIAHIEQESRVLRPLLERVSEEEWERIGASLAGRRDPLFSPAVVEEYRSLYRAILAAENGLVPGANARPKPAAV